MTNEIPKGEIHPAAKKAYKYIKEYIEDNFVEIPLLIESFASNAIEGNKTAKYCLGTLERILEGKPVGERYILGLAWTLKEMEDDDN